MAPSTGPRPKGSDLNATPIKAEMSTTADTLSAKLSRKRTKTGCLTCRKRRIKCGEERPTCRNCVKSKRPCEGYAQRVIFKQSTGYDYQPVANGSAHITFHSSSLDGQPVAYQAGYPPGPVDPIHGSIQHIPVEHFHPGYSQPAYASGHLPQQQSLPTQLIQQSPGQNVPPGYIPQPAPSQQVFVGGLPVTYHHSPTQHAAPIYPVTTAGFGTSIDYSIPTNQSALPAFAHTPGQPVWQQDVIPQDQKWQHSSPTTSATLDKVSPTSAHSSNTVAWNNVSVLENASPSLPHGAYAPQYLPSHQVQVQPPSEHPQARQQLHTRSNTLNTTINQQLPDFYEHVQQQFNTSNILAQAAVETQDDDYYDVEPDEEMETETSMLSSIDRERQQTLHTILQLNNISIQDLHTRRYDTFLYDGILTDYKPEAVASPLRNPATARVFAHFISVTGPSLSIYERHPLNTSVLFTPGEIPFSQQGLWTYTMPMAALHHQGLLHAMLALASLHIARLQNDSPTPSMQHYSWSLKRIHSCVKNAKKRYKLTTIAATMLLGFYEIMTAEHNKWNMHLTGSKQLFLETDFVTMSRQFRHLKMERMMRIRAGEDINHALPNVRARDEILDQISDVDDRIVSDFAGKAVKYDDHGHIVTQNARLPPELDLGRFEILRDLYWWYLKQDAYQSMISGNPLLLDYSKWTNCPPRAPLGKLDAVYGTFDHLMLLLGRIADFAARDRGRKLRQMDANGGNWIPPGSMRMAMPPQQPPATPVSAGSNPPMNGSQFPPASNAGGPPPLPQFYGMAPPPRDNVRMPASYMPANSIPTPDTASPKEFIDLPAARELAIAEYGRIRAALLAFQNSLGDGFLPYSADYYPPSETPFGFSLQYRSYDIGCLWAIYHMAVIIAIRSHPDMHPAAHVAAAICANDTKHHAEIIGRITAGMLIPGEHQPLNPTLGSSLCESCMPLFFAGIQYQNAAQRHHTISRIYTIAQRTGWGSAELIAHGCETAWVKAAQAGRGPPYERVLRHTTTPSEDPRKTGSWEHVDPNSVPDHNNEADRRFVTVKPNARLTWAIGIMGTEDDERLPMQN